MVKSSSIRIQIAQQRKFGEESFSLAHRTRRTGSYADYDKAIKVPIIYTYIFRTFQNRLFLIRGVKYTTYDNVEKMQISIKTRDFK